MITHTDIQRMRRAQSKIMEGRKVKPGDFYLRKFTCIAISPEGENTYDITDHMYQPLVEVLRGDEIELFYGMMDYAGDIICTFKDAVDVVFRAPTEVGGYFHDEVRYLGKRYGINCVWPKGVGFRPDRLVVCAGLISGQ